MYAVAYVIPQTRDRLHKYKYNPNYPSTEMVRMEQYYTMIACVIGMQEFLNSGFVVNDCEYGLIV